MYKDLHLPCLFLAYMFVHCLYQVGFGWVKNHVPELWEQLRCTYRDTRGWRATPPSAGVFSPPCIPQSTSTPQWAHQLVEWQSVACCVVSWSPVEDQPSTRPSLMANASLYQEYQNTKASHFPPLVCFLYRWEPRQVRHIFNKHLLSTIEYILVIIIQLRPRFDQIKNRGWFVTICDHTSLDLWWLVGYPQDCMHLSLPVGIPSVVMFKLSKYRLYFTKTCNGDPAGDVYRFAFLSCRTDRSHTTLQWRALAETEPSPPQCRTHGTPFTRWAQVEIYFLMHTVMGHTYDMTPPSNSSVWLGKELGWMMVWLIKKNPKTCWSRVFYKKEMCCLIKWVWHAFCHIWALWNKESVVEDPNEIRFIWDQPVFAQMLSG